MNPDQFVNLHVHTEYSLLDGACRIKELISRVKELGQTAVAITDHGNMYGVAEFWKEAVKQGIKPVIGCEVYVARRSRFDKEPQLDSKPYHLVLLCENNTGYSNLVKLVSLASIEGFYNKPRVDIGLLRQYHEGLICLSACLAGEIPQLLLNGDYESAKAKALEYREIFGSNNYYIEIQNHGIGEEVRILPQLLRLSSETGIPLAATNDCHYINKEDSKIQEILLCIQTGKNLGEPNGMRFEGEEFYVKSADEMMKLFGSHPEAVTNTALIAERCNVTMNFDSSIKLPKFKVEGVTDNDAYFRSMCEKGLVKRYGSNITPQIRERLEHELNIISELHFTDYFLIVWDFIRFARENGIPVGPGRGSGAGSLCAYCMGITGIDPIKYNLLFERFLNPERGNMPDFDIDFCIEGRQRVKDYVVQKYGSDRVSEIIAFDTMKARAAIRDVGRVMGMSYQICDAAAKLVDPKLTLQQSLDSSEDLRKLYDSDRNVRRLIDVAGQIEGMPRHTSVHAAGVVISAVPLSDLVPLQKNDGTVVTQYTMTYLEELGLLKMDFLGLRNLTIIRDTVREIRKTEPDFNIDRIPIDDPEVYKMLAKGDTAGVFQFESDGMTARLMELVPERIEDLIVMLSLYRPGPMKSIPIYIQNKRDPSKVKYMHPMLEDILGETYGVMVYQEQVMEICRKLAGYSYGHADEIRRAMAKKKQDVMLRERSSFVEGAVKNGVSENTANSIFDEMVSFASYAFNKSHAAAYAYLSYQTAYLKCHYRGKYMAALMSSVMGNTDKLSEYIDDCRSAGIVILPPDINNSMKNFASSVSEDKTINMYYGLLAIKNVGSNLADKIIAERAMNGNFKDIYDFCERIQGHELNKKALENMIKAGSFDGYGLNRHQMLEHYESIMSDANNSYSGVIEGQLNFMDGVSEENVRKKIPFLPEFEHSKLLSLEKEASGMYLSGDPLSVHKYLCELLKTSNTAKIKTLKDGDNVRLMCSIKAKKLHTAKNGKKMCFMDLMDSSGEVDSVVFPDLYALSYGKLNTDNIIFVKGTVNVKDDSVSVLCNVIAEEHEFTNMVRNMKLCIRTESAELGNMQAITDICGRFRGETPVCFYLSDLRKTVMPKNKLSLEVNEKSFEELIKAYGADRIGLI